MVSVEHTTRTQTVINDGFYATLCWFRVKASNAWELDIAVIVAGAWKRWIARALVTSVLIAVPSILALVPQSIPQDQKYTYYGMAVLFGFFAELVATYKIERLD